MDSSASWSGSRIRTRPIEGLFARETWLAMLSDCGFVASSAMDGAGRVVFASSRPTTLPGR